MKMKLWHTIPCLTFLCMDIRIERSHKVGYAQKTAQKRGLR